LHILVLGAAGMVGRKLTERLLRDGRLGSSDITRMTLQDVVAPAKPVNAGFPVDTVTCDFAVPGAAEKLVADRPDVIFHLAAIVSGEAELDFDKGYRINLDGTRMLLDAIRLIGGGYKPRVVFTSSIAVFGAPFPEAIGDEFFQTPLLSYGTQKAIGELLLADYSRRGFMDGIGIRLPTICIRPGLPNKAASGFFSNILREPLAGQEVVLPVSEDVRHWHASPRSAIGGGGAPQPHHARPFGDGRRRDRSLEAGGGRQGGGAYQTPTGRVHHGYRRRLAAQLRRQPGAQARFHHRRADFRRYYSESHRR
jgi:nucleoside-diphosphate-sugar epimerase